MFRLFNTFTLQLSKALPHSCLIISLCLSGKFFSVYEANVKDSFQMDELHFYAWLRKKKLSLKLQEKTGNQGNCVCVRAASCTTTGVSFSLLS